MTSREPVHVTDDVGRHPGPSFIASTDPQPRDQESRSRAILRAIALLALSAAITLTMQVWVGSATIYSPELQSRRERLHEMILTNKAASPDELTALGINTTNIRIGSVYFAEAIHRVTGASVMRVYRVIDSLALFIALPLLVRLYGRGTRREHALLAMLYVAAILPLTYVLHYFHPWDRPMLVLWILMIGLVRDDRPLLLAGVLMTSMIVKFDALFLPGLYFLVHARRDTLGPVAVRTAALFAVSFGTYAVLRMIFPGGSAVGDTAWQVATNFKEMRDYNIGYPPLLGLSVPLFLSVVGWRHADRFAHASAVFAAGLAAIYFANSNFAELRAMMPVLLLLIPVALAGLRLLTSSSTLVATTANRAEVPPS